MMIIRILLFIQFFGYIHLCAQEKKELKQKDFSQDYSEILQLLNDELKKDTISLYYRFDNRELFYTLEDEFFDRENEIYNKYDSIPDEINLQKDLEELRSPFIIVYLPILNIETYYYQAENLAKRTHGKKIMKYYPNRFEKDKDKRPLLFISIPLITVDERKAFIFGSYVCGNLCGGNSVREYEKLNGKWTYKNFIPLGVF